MTTYNKFATIICIFSCLFLATTDIVAQKSQAQIKQEISGHIKMLEEYFHKTISMDQYIQYMASSPSNLAMFEDIKKTMRTSPTYQPTFVEERIKMLKEKLAEAPKPIGKQ